MLIEQVANFTVNPLPSPFASAAQQMRQPLFAVVVDTRLWEIGVILHIEAEIRPSGFLLVIA